MSDDVVVLVGNPRPGSRTRQLAEATAAALVEAIAARGGPALGGLRVLELAEIVGVSFGPEPARPSTVVEDAHAIVRQAALLVVATPTYKGTYTGLLKLFLDQYGHRELADVVAVPVAIAAAQAHRQSVATALVSLLGELGATVAAPTLAVLESTLDDPRALADAWASDHVKSIVDVLR